MDNIVGERIKKRRKELDYTLKDLSEKSGVLPQLISDYENGRKEPGIKNIKLLCNALKVRPNYLLEDIEQGCCDNADTYGAVLYHYFEALNLSINDKLDINKENNTVDIHINDKTLVKVFVQCKDFFDIGGEAEKTLQNMNISLLSTVKIKPNDEQ